MCGIKNLFGGGGGGASAQMQQALLLQAIGQQQAAQQAQAAAAAQIAAANLDSEGARRAGEDRIRRANAAQGFLSSVLGGAQPRASAGQKMLFGQ